MLFRKVIIVVVAQLIVTGCTAFGEVRQVKQTHFNFPNSNVISLSGKVQGEASSVGLMPSWSGKLMRAAVENALKGSEADLIVNATYTKTATSILNIFWSNKIHVEGTPAKAEIGMQKLE
tara:strand:- start:240 stop:599 length:360 start_codon:yes stop_codon:yes gene_type:complete